MFENWWNHHCDFFPLHLKISLACYYWIGGLWTYGPEEKGMLDNDTNLEEFQSICIGTQVTLLLLVAITTCFGKIVCCGWQNYFTNASSHKNRSIGYVSSPLSPWESTGDLTVILHSPLLTFIYCLLRLFSCFYTHLYQHGLILVEPHRLKKKIVVWH